MNPELITHYYNTPLYLTHFEKTGKSGGFIKLPFQHPKSLVDPNIITYPQLEKFKTTNMYIFRKSMNIPDYDAELVIEHVSSTNFGTPIYVVFLLKKTKNAQWSAIDDVIVASSNTLLGEKPTSIHLDKLVATAIQNDCLTNVNGSVYVLVHPIPISSTHNLDDLTVSNTMLLEHSFNPENAVKCRVAAFQDAHTKNILSGGKPVIEGATTMEDAVESSSIDLTKIDPANLVLDCSPGDIDGEEKVLMTFGDINITEAGKAKSSMVMLIVFLIIFCLEGVVFMGVFRKYKGMPEKLLQAHIIIRLFILSLLFSGFMMFIKANSIGITVGTSLIIISVVSFVILSIITRLLDVKLTQNFFMTLINSVRSASSSVQGSSIPLNPIFIVVAVLLVCIGSILIGVFAGLPKFKRSKKPGPKAGLAIGIIFLVFGVTSFLPGAKGIFQNALSQAPREDIKPVLFSISSIIIVVLLVLLFKVKIK